VLDWSGEILADWSWELDDQQRALPVPEPLDLVVVFQWA
jgi:hypothetical protein